MTAGVMVAVAVVVLIFSYIPAVMNTLVAVLCAGGAYELYSATGFIKNIIPSVILMALFAVLAFVEIPHYHYVLGVLLCSMIAVCIYLMSSVKKIKSVPKWLSVIISVMMAMMFKSITGIRYSDRGLLLLIYATLIGVMTDTGAFFVGKALGSHKLAPILSPKKTVEGAIGGVLLSFVVTLSCALIINRIGSMYINIVNICIFSVVGSVIGQFGDLAMSSIKRISGIKDYGKIFPGHGGILDRFDGLMFVLPITYLASQHIIPFFA